MSKKLTTETLIIGAGPAGLATAMELAKAGKDFIVVEKDSVVGGLAKTYRFKEGKDVFLTDNGPHRFFSKNPYLYDFIEDLLNEKWITVNRQTRQFIDGKFYDYPVNATQALKNLGFFKSTHILVDYLIAKIRFGMFKKPIENFDDYVVANFGRTLGEFNMINYTEKIWGIPAKTIHADWAGQRIKGLSLTSLARDAVGRSLGLKSKNSPKTLVDTFYYPDTGTGLIYDTIVDRIKEKGYKVLLNTQPVAIKHKNGLCKEAVLKGKDGEITIKFKNLVESVPLPQFIKLLEPSVPKNILQANSKLRYRNQVYVFMTLDKKSITTDQWIYFPDRSTPIARVSEMRNFSKKMSPAGKTSFFVEIFCFEDDEYWSMTDDQLYDMVVEYFEKIKFFKRKEVRRHYVMRAKNVYPVYDVNYKKFLNPVKKYLDSFNNLYFIGRPGRFRYNNQDHSLEMGILAAKSIIDGKHYDIEKVGDEKEYYESGTLRDKDQAQGS